MGYVSEALLEFSQKKIYPFLYQWRLIDSWFLICTIQAIGCPQGQIPLKKLYRKIWKFIDEKH